MGYWDWGGLARDIRGHACFIVQNTQIEKKTMEIHHLQSVGWKTKYEYIKLMSQCLNLGPHNAYKSVHTGP